MTINVMPQFKIIFVIMGKMTMEIYFNVISIHRSQANKQS